MANDSESAILIGFIVTIVIVGIAGGVTLIVFICLKWQEYKKRRSNTRVVPSRQRSRRRRGSRNTRVRSIATSSSNSHSLDTVRLGQPPPYAEIEYDPPPPYTALGVVSTRREATLNTRGSVGGSLTPIPQGRTVSRNNRTFGSHLNTGATNTPLVTPTGSMFRSVPGTREQSATSNVRSINMVQFDNDPAVVHPNQPMSVEVNIHVDNSNNTTLENG